jgi:hypothetical protein
MPLKVSAHDLPPSLVEDTAAHNLHPSAEPSCQSLSGPKTTSFRSQDRQSAPRRYLASIELIDAAEKGLPRSFMIPRWASSAEMSRSDMRLCGDADTTARREQPM